MSEDDRKARSQKVAERFGENLRRARRRVGLSQEQVAIRASLHRTEVGLLERGGRVARIDTLIQLAGAMSIPSSELLEGINWTPGDLQGGSFEFEEEPRRSR
ncbi:MAG TPA: helix-turn-helix transcriptional regulator [Solirubrobacterales bacterium]|jgi:transcriptional regulator with XRE-family HTH domain